MGKEKERSVQLSPGGDSRTSALICLNWGEPAAWHHSNSAASVVVRVTPLDSIRRSAIS